MLLEKEDYNPAENNSSNKIDENLREEMSKAYIDGKNEEALELSRRLDKQILKTYSKRRPRNKTPKKEKGREMQL